MSDSELALLKLESAAWRTVVKLEAAQNQQQLLIHTAQKQSETVNALGAELKSLREQIAVEESREKAVLVPPPLPDPVASPPS